MASDSAMFYFDTNINQVASDIAGGLRRINQSLSEPLRLNTTELATNTAGLGQMASRMEETLGARLQGVQAKLEGGLDGKRAREVFRREVKEAFSADIPKTLANELGLASNSVATTVPAKQLAEQYGRDFITALRTVFRQHSPELGSSLRNVRFTPDIRQLAANPVAFGQETAPTAALRNQLRAEGILRRDPSFQASSQEIAQRMGFSSSYMRDLKGRTVAETEVDGVTTAKFSPTDAGQRLRDITRANSDAQTTANRQRREAEAADARAERERQAAEKAAARERQRQEDEDWAVANRRNRQVDQNDDTDRIVATRINREFDARKRAMEALRQRQEDEDWAVANRRNRQVDQNDDTDRIVATRINREFDARKRAMEALHAEAIKLNDALNERNAAHGLDAAGVAKTGPGYRVEPSQSASGEQEYYRRTAAGAVRTDHPLDKTAIDNAIIRADQKVAQAEEKVARTAEELATAQELVSRSMRAHLQNRPAWMGGSVPRARDLQLDNSNLPPLMAPQTINPKHFPAIDTLMKQGTAPNWAQTYSALRGVPGSGFQSGAPLSHEYVSKVHAAIVEGMRDETTAAAEAVTEAAAKDAAYLRHGGVLTDVDSGAHFKQTTVGVTPVTHPITLSEADARFNAIQAQRANAAKLAENADSVVKTGGYRVLGQEVYKLSQYGAERVTQENRVTEALAGQERVLRSEMEMAQRQLATVERAAAVQARVAARDESRQGGALSGFMNRTFGGNQQVSLLNNVGTHIASAVQFTAGYGALFAIQGAIRDTIKEYMDYQDSMTDLQVATKNTGAATQSWVNDLSEVARVTGENVGASMDVASRAVRAFSIPGQQSTATLQAIGSAASDAANKLALISSKPLTDAYGDLQAVSTSYKLAPDQFNQVVDAVANAKRNMGGDPKEISQGLASIASSASVSGFDVNQAANLISLVQGRVDETGLAAATRLTRIFQTTSGTTGKGLGKELGVDTNQSVEQQLLGPGGYADIYNDKSTSQAVKNRITSQLGGTANLRELLAVLENAKQLQHAFGLAAKEAGGGTAEFNRKAASLAGTLTQVRGDIMHIQTDLGRTDLGAPFGMAVYAIEPLLHLTDRFLQMIDALPAKLKISLGLAADVLIAGKAIAVLGNARAAIQARGGILTSGTSARAVEADTIAAAVEARAAAEARYIAVLNASTEARAAAEGVEVTTIEAATVERAGAEAVSAGETVAGGASKGLLGGIAQLGKFALNPWVMGAAIVGGAGYMGEQYLEGRDERKHFGALQAGTADSLNRVDGTSSTIASAIKDFQSTAGQVENANSNMFSRTEQRAAFDNLQGQIKDLKVLQARVNSEEAANAVAQKRNVFGDGGVITSIGQLTNGLTALADAGVTARKRMELLIGVLRGHATPASGQSYDPDALSAKASTTLVGSLRNILPKHAVVLSSDTRRRPDYNTKKGYDEFFVPEDKGASDIYDLLSSRNSTKRIADAYKAKATQMGIKVGDTLTEPQRETLARAAADALDLKTIIDPAEREKVREKAYAALVQSMQPGGTKQERLLNGTGKLSNDDIMKLINPSKDGTWAGLQALQQQAQQSVPKTDDGSIMVNVNKRYLDMVRALKKRLGNQDVGQLDDMVQNAEDDYARSVMTRLEKLRQHEQGMKGLSKNAIRTIGRKYLSKEITAAGDDTALLIEIMDRADKTSLDIIERHLKRAAELAAHERATALSNPAFFHPRGGQDGPVAEAPPLPGQSQAEQDYQQFHKARGQANPSNDPYGGDYAGGGGSAVNNKKKKSASSGGKVLTAEQQAARAAGASIDPDRTVAVARNDLASALADLHAAKHGTADYYTALKAVNTAKNSLASAEADHTTAIANAQAARIGGGLAAARAQITGAAVSLRNATRGTTSWWNALASFYQGQQAMRDAVVAYANAKDQLHGDITDPVENARDALRASIRKMHADRGKDTKAEDKVQVRQDSAAYADAKFQQRLSDMQTGEDLGRISFAKYMAYLDHEHDRLSKIHKRTRQQQTELDTIDKAIKDSLSSADSQFNLGDINTNGLVYQVREFKKELAGGGGSIPRMAAAAAASTQQTVHISINGADTAMVKRTIDSYLRIGGGQRQSLTRRKV